MRFLTFIIFFVLGVATFSCRDKVVCPAYQSTYLLDPVQRDQFFSLFEGDSIPKGSRRKLKKNKNGTMVLVAYTTRSKQFRIVPMYNVLPLEPLEETDTVMLAYVSPFEVDSLGLDSATLFSKTKRKAKGIKYNYDQLWYEENIEELTREDGVDPQTIFSKKKPKKEVLKPVISMDSTLLDVEDPLDFEFENFDDFGNDSTVLESIEPVLDIDSSETPTKDDGTDDF